jgi:branched-chain amino acid transport system permease protein
MAGSKMDIRTGVASSKMTPTKLALYVAIALVLVVVPIIFTGFGQLFAVRIMAVVGLYVLLALGLNIVVGYAGLLDLGYIAFYAMGAYGGVLMGEVISKWLVALTHNPASVGATFYLTLPVGAAVAAMTGIALGTPVLRLRGDYLAIVTLGFGEIIRILITNDATKDIGTFLTGTGIPGITALGGLFLAASTNGAAGLPTAGKIIPPPWPLMWLKDNIRFKIPGTNFDFVFTDNLFWYCMIVILCLLTIFMVMRLDNSRLGRSWVAMREDEVAASSMGVNITVAKLWAFSLGAMAGGIAGVTFANFQGFVSPESFTFMESVFVVCVVVIGGMGSIPGVIVGAIIIQGIPEAIRGMASSGLIKLTGEQVALISNYRFLVFGLLLVIMMAWRPQGFIPSKRRAMELQPEDEDILGEENQTLYDAQHNDSNPGSGNNF